MRLKSLPRALISDCNLEKIMSMFFFIVCQNKFKIYKNYVLGQPFSRIWE